jgi:transcriptional regulator with XRE-family HTH domain
MVSHVQPQGSTIRRRREELGYDLTPFARSVGVSPSYLSRIETGKCNNPSPGLLKRIAVGLRAEVTDIADHEERTYG